MAPPRPSPLKKFLIADPKPKPAPISASSATSMLGKRTRNQPNLSDCHCCGRRIIHSNPKDRLQPMDSVWRIVLLCRKCRRSVCSGQTCPYCFQFTGNSGDFCTCIVCRRKIHKDCVKDYGKSTPWCYLEADFEGFKVCVDCWVPELLKNSGRSENVGGLKDKWEGKSLMENVLHSGKCEANMRLKEHMSRGSQETIDEVLVDGASDLIPKNDKDSLMAGYSNDETELVHDAELAVQLHRVINSSTRILNGKSLRNPNDLDVPSLRTWKGLCYKRSGLGKRCSENWKLEVCKNTAEIGRVTHTVGNDSRVGLRGLSLGLIAYERRRKWKSQQLENTELSEPTSSQQSPLKNSAEIGRVPHTVENDSRIGFRGLSLGLIAHERRRKWKVRQLVNTEISEPTSSQQAALKNFHSDEAEIRSSLMSGSDLSEDSFIDGCGYGQELMSYKRNKFKKKVCQFNGLVGDSGDSSGCGDHGVVFNSESFQLGYANLHATCLVKSDTNEILLSGSANREHDRYHLKYVKRIRGTKTGSSFLHGVTLLNETQVSASVGSCSTGFSANDCELILPNGTCAPITDRYSLKYSKRVKSLKPPTKFRI